MSKVRHVPGYFASIGFAILLAFISQSHGADVTRFQVLKGLYYDQDAEGHVVLSLPNSWRFSAVVSASKIGNVTGASLTTSHGNREDLLPDLDGNPFRIKDKFSSQAALENKYPNGAFTLAIGTTHDGTPSIPMSITGDVYPAPGVLLNYDAAQQLPYSEYNQFSWQPFAGATASDFIQFQIEDVNGHNVWSTPDIGQPGALNGLATRTILPPNTLSVGIIYVGTLRFVKVQQGSSGAYPGVPGMAGYFTDTHFFLHAVSPRLIPVTDQLQLWRTQRSEQTATGAPSLQPHAYEFSVQLDAVGTNLIRSVDFKPPTSAPQISLAPTSDFAEFDFSDTTPTNVIDFRAQYPGGNYSFAIARDGASDHPIIDLPATPFPPAPNLSGLNAFVLHPPGQDLVVAWEPWRNATEPDFIRVELYDGNNKVYDTPSYRSENHLRYSETTATIPGGNFVAGHDYELRVTFFHVSVSDTRVIPGALVYGGEASRTKFQFSTVPPDALRFSATITQKVWQRSDSLFQPDATQPFSFEAIAEPSADGALKNVTVTTAAGAALTLATNLDDPRFTLKVIEPDATALALHYPTGLYAFRFDTTHDGLRTSSVKFASVTLPPAPQVLRLPALSFVKANADYNVGWKPWVGADTNNDSIEFTLEDAFGRTLDLGNVGLTVLSTNILISNNNNQNANRSYLARLRFVHGTSSEKSSYPGARGTATIVSETDFYISTLNSASPFSESSFALNAAGQLQFRVTNPQLGRTYVLYGTQDLASWQAIQTNTVTGNALILTLPPSLPRAFFKTVLLP